MHMYAEKAAGGRPSFEHCETSREGKLMKKAILAMTAMLLASTLIMLGVIFYYQEKMQYFVSPEESMKEYDHHYLFVSADRSGMVQDVFKAASENAGQTGGYLEWCGSGTDNSYTEAECIDISIAMKADGILVCPDGSKDLEDAIDRASEAGIPVVTIMRDLPDSSRVSYAGVSGYQIGELYGGRLISMLHEGTNDVCLLEDKGTGKDETQLLYTRMIQSVNSGAPSGKMIKLRTEEVDNSTDFDTEEVIRNLLLGNHVPDILICVNPIQTECAIQALIDYNLVGDVQVIGYYATKPILHALKQQLIPVTMTIDTAQLGEYSVQALDEYRKLKRVNSYYNIALDSITPRTVDEYIEAHGLGEEEKEDQLS